MQFFIKILCIGWMVAFAVSAHTKPRPGPSPKARCTTSCNLPFGKLLGQAQQVQAYSNCNNDCESQEWDYVLWRNVPIKTGMKWQCVEYARRWYISQLGHSFASIDHAYQIWALDSAIQLGTKKKTPWLTFKNGESRNRPQKHDLLIYNTKQGVHGHVAVVAGVGPGLIKIAEQNYTNTWENSAYARTVPWAQDADGKFKIDDLGLIGWMRLDKNKEQAH